MAATATTWDYVHGLLVGPIDHPLDLAVYPPSGLLKGFGQVALITLALIFCVMTLPTPGTAWLRLAALPLLVYHSLHIAIDRSITYGAPLRDCFWPLLGWHLIAKELDICLSSLLDRETDKVDEVNEKAPRWIVPKSQARRFPGAVEISKPKMNGQVDGEKSDDEVTVARASTHSIEQQWYLVPHAPLLSFRRFLWAFDHLTLVRAHTSYLFPKEQRAMEWAHRHFYEAALHPERSLYGKPEDSSILSVLLKLSAMVGFFSHAHLLVVGPGEAYYALPYSQQLFIIFFYGCWVAWVSGIAEYLLLFPVLSRAGFPASMLLPTMRQPLMASGPSDFWIRWHAYVRRVSWRVARLLPGGRDPRGKMNKVWAFVLTGTMHSFLFGRWVPEPPSSIWQALWIGLIPGPLFFFIAQGVAVGLEQALLGPPPKVAEQRNKAIIRRVLLWTSLCVSGRWFAGAIASTGLHTPPGQASVTPQAMGLMFKQMIGLDR